jgi:Fe-Mn family superoxide dismutase
MDTTNNTDRREFLKTAGKAGLVTGLSFTALSSFAKGFDPFAPKGTPYAQQPLPYAYGALEPIIDATTMELHYSKHAATYAKNLAEAVKAENVNTAKTPLEDVLANISKYSPKLRNNGGGHYNHELFWQSMAAPGGAKPSGKLKQAIEKDFNSIEAFTAQFTDAGKNRFGSGWAWLVIGKDNKLIVGSTPNQDNPLMDISDLKGFPLLGLDVWEHAYYLKYQNRRPDYINAWWNVVNWNFVEERFAAAGK